MNTWTDPEPSGSGEADWAYVTTLQENGLLDLDLATMTYLDILGEDTDALD